MKFRLRYALFPMLALLFFAELASADTFTVSYNDGTNTATGSLWATDLDGQSFLATNGSITFTTGILAGTYSLLPTTAPGVTPTGCNWCYSPSTHQIFDNMLFKYNEPFLTGGGLLFVGTGGTPEVNIFSRGGNSYSLYSWNGTTYDPQTDDGEATLINVPEPSGFPVLALGTLMVGVFAASRRKSQSVSSNL